MENNVFEELKKTALRNLIIAIIIGLLFFLLSLSFIPAWFKISFGVFILALAVSFLVPSVYNLLKIQDDMTNKLILVSQSAKILRLLKKDEPEIIQFEKFLTNSLLDKRPYEGGGYVLYNV